MELLLCALINNRQKREPMELGSTKANVRQKGETVELGSTKVRRNLFGPVDHNHLQQDFQNMLCASMERAKRRWNFDFLEETPAEGLLQWEELKGHEVPTFYHTCVVGEARRPLLSMNRVVTKESKAHQVGKVFEKPRPAQKLSGKKNLAGQKRRQRSLTDYYSTKKQIRMDMQTPVKKLAF